MTDKSEESCGDGRTCQSVEQPRQPEGQQSFVGSARVRRWPVGHALVRALDTSTGPAGRQEVEDFDHALRRCRPMLDASNEWHWYETFKRWARTLDRQRLADLQALLDLVRARLGL